MLRYLVDPIFQVINTAGKPATGGFIEVYLHGTRDKYYCASDFDGTLHPFRIPLDSLGSNIILADDANAYDIYVYNRYGSLLMSRYNVTPSASGGGGGSGGTFGELQHWLGGYGPTYTPFPGDNRGHTLGISKRGLQNNEIDYVGDFIDRIETCPYPDGVEDGYIYLKPGLYFVDCIIRYQQDSEDLSNTLDEVLVYTGYGNANESIAYQLDSSGPEATENRHNLRVSFVRHVTSTEGKLLYFAPSSRVDWTDAYIQKLQIVKLDGIRGEKGEQGPQGPAGQDGQDGPTYTAGDGIKIENDVISTDIAVVNGSPIDADIDFGQSFNNLYAITTDGHRIRTDSMRFTLPSIKAGNGISFSKNGNETTISMNGEVGDVVETVEKLKKDLDTQITTNFDMPNISQVYDFADPSVSTLANGACMLCQSFTIPINHELRTVTDDENMPTLLGIYAQQNFAHKIMLALYEYTYAGEGEEHGSSTYVGDTGPVDVVQGVNEFPLKNRNPSITELRSDKVYYATLYLPNAARVNGLLLAGAPNYGNGSIPAEPRLTCAVENITWNGQELDMSDPTTTLNHYQEVIIPGEPTYYQYYIGPWNSGYNERQTAPRFYMQIRNGEYNVPVVPTAPFVDLGDALPRGTLTQTDIPSFTPSQANSAYRDVTPLMNVTITGFEWIDGMSTAAGWAAANCVFDSGFSTNLSGVSNTVTDLGQVVSGEYPGYAHRITFTTPLTLTAGTTYRFLCGCTDGSPYFKVWLDPTDVIYFGNNGWYVDISNLTRDEHHAGMYNKLYDSNNNSYVI